MNHAAVAHLRVSGHRGTFVAASCDVNGLVVDVVGQWRRGHGEFTAGSGWAKYSYGPTRHYTWPISRIVEILWLDEQAAA